MKKVITTMSAMTIVAQINAAQAEEQGYAQSPVHDSEIKYADEDSFKGSGFVDLSVEKSVILLADNDNSGTATEGDILEYRIEINNLSTTVDANNLYLLDQLESRLSLNIGSVITSDGIVITGNNPNDGNLVEVSINSLPAGWYSVVNFEAELVNLDPGINVVYNEAIVFGPQSTIYYSDDPSTPEPDDPTLIDAYGDYPDLIFADGFEGSASGGFF